VRDDDGHIPYADYLGSIPARRPGLPKGAADIRSAPEDTRDAQDAQQAGMVHHEVDQGAEVIRRQDVLEESTEGVDDGSLPGRVSEQHAAHRDQPRQDWNDRGEDTPGHNRGQHCDVVLQDLPRKCSRPGKFWHASTFGWIPLPENPLAWNQGIVSWVPGGDGCHDETMWVAWVPPLHGDPQASLPEGSAPFPSLTTWVSGSRYQDVQAGSAGGQSCVVLGARHEYPA
jgi:hypothetical protein